MKKVLCLFVLCSLLLVTSGCGDSSSTSASKTKSNKEDNNSSKADLVCKAIIEDKREYSLEYDFDFNSDDSLKSVECTYVIYSNNPYFDFYETICDEDDFVADTCSFIELGNDKYELKAKRTIKSKDETILGDLHLDGDETKKSTKEYMESGSFNNYTFECK